MCYFVITYRCSEYLNSLMKKIIIEKEWNRLDGKWSWVIAAGTFCCMVMISGISMTVGIYHPVFLEAFHGGSGNTAIVSALNFGMMSFIGKMAMYYEYHYISD